MLVHVDLLSKDGDTITFKSRKYEVNTDGITDVMTKMAKDIGTQIENAQLSNSNIVIEKISKTTTNYDKYNPTGAGSYVELPEWLSLKKACISIKNEDQKCFKYCVQCSVFKTYEKETTHIELLTIRILEIMLLIGDV